MHETAVRETSSLHRGEDAVRVALAYNAKPGAKREIVEARPELVADEEEEPPPLGSSPEAYAEWDDAQTILALADALAQRFDVQLVEATRRFPLVIARVRPDLVFNVAEGCGGPGRESQVPAVLEMLGIPYTGSDSLTLAVCLHKGWTSKLLRAHGILAPRHVVVTRPDEPLDLPFPWPAIVKPSHEGSSMGIHDDQVVRAEWELRAVLERVLGAYGEAVVEEFLPGREFTVAVLGNPPHLRVLPPVELVFDGLPPGASPIYSWEAKWVWDSPQSPLEVFRCPAGLTHGERASLEAVVRGTVAALRIRDWARIDVRMDGEGQFHVIDVNPLPGMLPDPRAHSCFPEAARAAGMGYAEVVHAVVDAACQRLGLPWCGA